jgi:protein-S-isoprenylcysteine O-methyltransferase Ste14
MLLALELKIPPPIYFILCAIGIWALAGFDWKMPEQFGAAHTIAVLLKISGVVIAIIAVVQFRMARTTIHPQKPEHTSQLVTSGIFQLSRNPMYLGMALILFGIASWHGVLISFVFPLIFITVITWLQILPEERAMRAKFGATYETYCKNVRRWL